MNGNTNIHDNLLQSSTKVDTLNWESFSELFFFYSKMF